MRDTLGVPVEVTQDRRAAVRTADLVTCSTTAARPIFSGRDLHPGTHVDAVGAARPGNREIDTEGVRTTHASAVFARSGDRPNPVI